MRVIKFRGDAAALEFSAADAVLLGNRTTPLGPKGPGGVFICR